jgi:hypothetical protein
MPGANALIVFGVHHQLSVVPTPETQENSPLRYLGVLAWQFTITLRSFRIGRPVRPECPPRPSSSLGDSRAIVHRDNESQQSR